MMNTYIRKPFIEEYIKIINSEVNKILSFIPPAKEDARLELDNIFILNSDTVLSEIDNKLNILSNSIKSYEDFFNNTFAIPKEVENFLFEFSKN